MQYVLWDKKEHAIVGRLLNINKETKRRIKKWFTNIKGKECVFPEKDLLRGNINVQQKQTTHKQSKELIWDITLCL